MKLTKSRLLNLFLVFLISFFVVFISGKNFFRHFELTSLDTLFRLKTNSPTNPHIIIVEITDDDISKIGVWSWSRSWHAAMLKALDGLGAKIVYFDILFSEPSDEKGDKAFEEAIKTSKNAYLPFTFQGHSFELNNAITPIPRFSPYLKGMGSINIYPDSDGVCRRIPLIFTGQNVIRPHIVLKIAMDYLGLKIKEINSEYLLLSNSKKIKIPLTENSSMLINWKGKWQNTFKHYGFLQILAAYQDSLEKKRSEINLEEFKNSICLVTVTAIGICDIKAIPLQTEYPGAGITATAINNILNNEFITTAPRWLNFLLIFLLSFIPALLTFREKPLLKTAIVFMIGIIYCIFTLLLFRNNILINFVAPLSALVISYFCFATYNFVRVALEKRVFYQKATTDALTGLYNIGYFKILLDAEVAIAKPNPDMKLSLIMSDVDHFKQFNDNYGHQVGDLVLKEVASVLKTSVRSSDVVARYGGEEMIILLRGGSLESAMNVAEKIRQNVESHKIWDIKGPYNVTLSLGVAYLNPLDSADTLIKRADEGLYKAKESGRNRVCTVETT